MFTKKILIISLISIILFSLFSIDRISSDNPSDPAYIHIGTSNKDTSGCNECKEGGIFYYGGCKKCPQDSMILYTKTVDESRYYLGWSNDNSMYRGDSECEGNKAFPYATAKSNDNFWVEMIREDLKFTITLYNDPNFQEIYDSQTIQMCSKPTDLQFLRITTEDGKPAGNGGQIEGHIDDIKIWNNVKKSQLNNLIQTPIFIENFSSCEDKSCENKWHLEDDNVLFVDNIKKNFYFNSQVSATNDDALYYLDKPLDDENWILHFKFHIDKIIEHPHGKGIFEIDPELRRNMLAIPALILSIFSVGVFYKFGNSNDSKFLIINGVVILIETLLILIIKDPILPNNINSINLILWTTPIIVSIVIIAVGISKNLNHKFSINDSK